MKSNELLPQNKTMINDSNNSRATTSYTAAARIADRFEDLRFNFDSSDIWSNNDKKTT